MANVGGPKGNDPGKLQKGGRILPFRGTKTADPAENKREISEVRSELDEGKGGVFDPGAPTIGKDDLPDQHVEVVRGAGIKARLAALGVKGTEGLIKAAPKDGVRVKDTPLGRIIDGNVTVESAGGLHKLDGVARITGDLVVQESAARSMDFLALKSLVELGGRLVIEGNAAVSVLDGLDSLERAKGIYIGFNTTLTRLSLPRLKQLDAALIIEGNPRLTEINLPAFEKGGLYLHVHDNAALTSVSLQRLEQLGEELSLLDNPRLVKVNVGSSQKPAHVAALELERNGAASFAALHTSST